MIDAEHPSMDFQWRVLKQPVHCKGRQRIFNVHPEIEKLVTAQLHD